MIPGLAAIALLIGFGAAANAAAAPHDEDAGPGRPSHTIVESAND